MNYKSQRTKIVATIGPKTANKVYLDENKNIEIEYFNLNFAYDNEISLKEIQEFTENKQPQTPRRGKWSLSFIVKEAAGFHSTSRVMIGSDRDYFEETPFDSLYYSYIRKNTNTYL